MRGFRQGSKAQISGLFPAFPAFPAFPVNFPAKGGSLFFSTRLRDWLTTTSLPNPFRNNPKGLDFGGVYRTEGGRRHA